MPAASRLATWFVVAVCGASLARTQQFVDTVPLPRAGYLFRYLPPADVDADGDVDLVACTPAGVRLFRNDGANRFGGGVLVSPVVGAWAGAVADFDGDLDGDVAVFTRVSTAGPPSTLYLLRNGGTTFTSTVAHQPAVATIEPMFLQPIDIDGDGDLDILAALGQGSPLIMNTALLLLENNGTGQFTDVTASWLAPPGPAAVSYLSAAVLDFDVDGRADVLLAATSLRLLRNTGTQFLDETAARMPLLTQIPKMACVADIDGDGDPDLLALSLHSGQPPVLLRNSAGVFADVTQSLLAPQLAADQAQFLDVDGDGDADLYARGGSPPIARVVINAGGGALLTVQPASDFSDVAGLDGESRMNVIHRCDLEGDGDDDLVLPHEYVGVLRGDGNGNLVDPWAGTRVAGSKVLDADGDGDGDLLTPGGLAVNDGFGAFTIVPFSGATPGGDAIADFDGDGDDDVGGSMAVFLSNGGGSFTAVPYPGSGASSTFALDFDADGNVDLLNLPLLSGPLSLFRNTGGGAMVFAQSLPGSARFADAADVDGDGDLDLVLSAGLFGGAVRLFLQSTPGVFVSGPTASLSGRAVFANLAGTGIPHIVVGGPPTVLRLVAGTLVDVTASTAPRFSGSEVLAADVDRDGDVDLVGDQLMRNNGTGVLRLEPLGLRSTPRSLRDLDGDGDLDLIARSNDGSANSLHVCWNREHHIDVPLPAATGRPLRLDVSALPGRAGPAEFAIVGVGSTRFLPGILTPFGELRLGNIGLTLALQITPVTGISALQLPIPASPAWVGLNLHFQALHLGPGAPVLGNLASTRIE